MHEAAPTSASALCAAFEDAIARGQADTRMLAAYAGLLAKLRRYERAAEILDSALRMDHGDFGLWWLLGACLRGLGQRDAAIGAYRRAVTLSAPARCAAELVRLLIDCGHAAAAAAEARRLAAAAPDAVDSWSALANALHGVGDYAGAVEAARAGLARVPGDAASLNALGCALEAADGPQAAYDAFAAAVRADPGRRTFQYNLGRAAWACGRYDEALAILGCAANGEPPDPRARKSLALLKLACGDYDCGWKEYRWRHAEHDECTPPPPPLLPEWDGSVRDGERIVICAEQGVGDEVMFAGLVPDLVARGVVCALTCDPRLVPLFSRSFGGVTVLPRGDYASLPDDATSWIWAGDLPRLLRPDRREGAWLPSPYLWADAARSASLRAGYADGRPLVGISWTTSNRASGPRRALARQELRRILAVDRVRWVSLQYGAPDELRDWCGPAAVIDEEIDARTDLDGFAAQIAAMDRVVTIDNSTVHFAGALGVPTWLLLPDVADWRWPIGRIDAAWYAQVQPLRQPAPRAWGPVLAELATMLERV